MQGGSGEALSGNHSGDHLESLTSNPHIQGIISLLNVLACLGILLSHTYSPWPSALLEPVCNKFIIVLFARQQQSSRLTNLIDYQSRERYTHKASRHHRSAGEKPCLVGLKAHFLPGGCNLIEVAFGPSLLGLSQCTGIQQAVRKYKLWVWLQVSS